MKSIALIHYRLIQRGGLERRLINYTKYFHSKGYQVTIFATKKDINIKLPSNVNFVRVKLGLAPKFFRKLYFARKIKKILPKYSIDLSLSLGRTFNQLSILDPGNHIGYMHCLGYRFKSLKDYLNIYLDRESFRQSKIIFACSKFIRDFNIKGFHTPVEKIKIVHPPINIFQFNQKLRVKRDSLRKKYRIKDEATTFLFISTGHKMKNLKFLIQLFESLNSDLFELVIAGSKPKNKLPGNIRYIGYIKEPDEIFTAVDYTIHPALYEPYGQVIAESIQCGTPVIISQNVGAKEVVSKNEGVIIDSFSIEQWIKEVHDLKNKTFNIKPSFAIDNELTLDQHMEKILHHFQTIS